MLLALWAGMDSMNTQAAGEVLTKVKEVLALPAKEAEAGTKSVRLRGVVTDVSVNRDEFSLHDGEACISVLVGGAAARLSDEVEVDGHVISEPHLDSRRTRIKSGKVTVLGSAKLPEAKSVSLEDAAKFKQLDQWVSVEGTVLQVRSSMSLFTIQMVSDAAVCNVLVRDWPREAIPRNWIGARVRVNGVNRAYLPGNSFLSVVVPSPDQVTVLNTGVENPLDAPPTTVGDLSRQGVNFKKERIKLTGTLLAATSGNVFYARGTDGGAFSFYMLHPIDEDKSGRFSTPVIIPKCLPGDVLEVVGMPSRVEPGVHLNFGVARVLRSGPAPPPVTAEIDAITSGNHVHDLVEVQGRLISLDDVLVAPGRFRTTMKLKDADQTIIAYHDSATRGALAHLQHDHRLRVQGIVTGAPHFPEIRLWIPASTDLESLGIAQDVVARRLWLGLGIAAMIVIMLGGWAFMLSRSRTMVRELNASLEKRVAERTAELAAAKDDLAQALSQERELHEMKTRFVSLVSHEFRTPLGVTMSAVEVLRHYRDRITEEKHMELLEDIHSATLQMSGLMEQVLLLGRAEAGKINWRPTVLNLPEFCAKLVDEGLSSQNHRCPVNFTVEGDFAEALMDESLVRHIIGNLLSNAVKYSTEGSPVDFRLNREGEQVIFVVQDRGIGIPAVDQTRLFEAFHRASNVGETPGTGLGLLLVKRCVELHHGSLEMQSQEGFGSTFTVRLPLRRQP